MVKRVSDGDAKSGVEIESVCESDLVTQGAAGMRSLHLLLLFPKCLNSSTIPPNDILSLHLKNLLKNGLINSLIPFENLYKDKRPNDKVLY